MSPVYARGKIMITSLACGDIVLMRIDARWLEAVGPCRPVLPFDESDVFQWIEPYTVCREDSARHPR
jgi:hypothetical protein